jgi:putative membrane protein
MSSKTIEIRNYIKYKFLNSVFLGMSVGSIFTIYTPLEPSVYSLGGMLLAFSMLFVANFYHKILTVYYFFKISLLVELVAFCMVGYFLFFSYSYKSAFVVYAGYQLTFTFGAYLLRAETIFLKKRKILGFIDMTNQKGYLFGMLLSYMFYKILELGFDVIDKQTEVYDIHFLLLFVESLIIYFLIKSFKNKKQPLRRSIV